MSYEIAATGLNAVNEQLDGIGNNIANAGTVGYKSMTTRFQLCMPEVRRWASAWRVRRRAFARRFAGFHR
ncbi:flagellar basal body protein [Escherichia coli]